MVSNNMPSSVICFIIESRLLWSCNAPWHGTPFHGRFTLQAKFGSQKSPEYTKHHINILVLNAHVTSELSFNVDQPVVDNRTCSRSCSLISLRFWWTLHEQDDTTPGAEYKYHSCLSYCSFCILVVYCIINLMQMEILLNSLVQELSRSWKSSFRREMLK